MRRLVCAIAAIASLFAAAPAFADCKVVKRGEVPLILRGGRILVQSKINGQDALLMVDTGAFVDTLSGEGAAKLGVATSAEERVRVIGVGGEERIRNAKLKDMSLGNFVSQNVEVLVAPRVRLANDVVGILGKNHFFGDDMEFNLAAKVIRIFRPEGCDGFNLAYWGQGFALAELMGDGRRTGDFAAEVLINGKKAQAKFDTGAPLTVLTTDLAKTADIDLSPAAAEPIGNIGGFGREALPTSVVRLKAFAIGDEAVSNLRVLAADLDEHTPERIETGSRTGFKAIEGPQMLIGLDFFMAHRIYFARSQKRIYFSYTGGPVFRGGDAIVAIPKPKSP